MKRKRHNKNKFHTLRNGTEVWKGQFMVSEHDGTLNVVWVSALTDEGFAGYVTHLSVDGGKTFEKIVGELAGEMWWHLPVDDDDEQVWRRFEEMFDLDPENL